MRGTLVICRSRVVSGYYVLRDGNGYTLHSHGSIKAAIRYCDQWGFNYTFPMERFNQLAREHGL